MKRYVKASDDDIVYTTASGKCTVVRVDLGDTFYDVNMIDRYGDKYTESFDDIDDAIACADEWEAEYQQRSK